MLSPDPMTDQENEETPKALDPIAVLILEALNHTTEMTVEELARYVGEARKKPKDGPQLWRKYMQAVKQQAQFLAKSERIAVYHKGEMREADDFKGRVHLRLKK